MLISEIATEKPKGILLIVWTGTNVDSGRAVRIMKPTGYVVPQTIIDYFVSKYELKSLSTNHFYFPAAYFPANAVPGVESEDPVAVMKKIKGELNSIIGIPMKVHLRVDDERGKLNLIEPAGYDFVLFDT